MNNIELIESLMLRGIEGKIQDRYLRKVSEYGDDGAIADYMEAKQMAEQVFAGLKGWI